MDMRGSKKPICEDLGLKEPLKTFKSRPFPKEKHVLLHFFFHLHSMAKKNGDDASQTTAKSVLNHWAPAGLPLMKLHNAKAKVKQVYERYCEICNMKKSKSTYQTKKAKFLASLETRFDVSAKDALTIIDADKTLSTAEKEGDRNFLLAIREDCPHSLGALDAKRIKRLKKAAEREQQAGERVKKERKRKQVNVGGNIIK